MPRAVRVFEAERSIQILAATAQRQIERLGSGETLLVAALNVIMHHNLLSEFAREHAEVIDARKNTGTGKAG